MSSRMTPAEVEKLNKAIQNGLQESFVNEIIAYRLAAANSRIAKLEALQDRLGAVVDPCADVETEARA